MERGATSNETPDDPRNPVEAAESGLAHSTEQDVAERAYRRWVDRGCPQGSPDEDWFEAERELLSQSRS